MNDWVCQVLLSDFILNLLTLPAKYFNKKHVGRVELDVLKPQTPDGNKRVTHIVGQIKGTASFIKSGIAKEIKLCLVDPKSKEVKEVYKFSAKELTNGDDGINAAMKQKRLLDMVEGFFRQIDTAMASFKGKPKKLGLVTMVDFVPGTDADSIKNEYFAPNDKDIQVTNGVKTKLGELSTDYHRMKVVAITAIENTTLSTP